MGSVAAQIDNSTQTPAYNKLYYNEPLAAVFLSFTEVWGPWFWITLIMGPYFMMYIYHGNRLSIASIWLLSALSAYEYLVAGMRQDFIFYAVIVVWVMSVILKLVSPVYHD